METNRQTILKILVPLAFLAMIAVNSLANALPIGGMKTGELSALYPNLFTPAGFTFSVWAVIYLLLGGFSVYQLLPGGTELSPCLRPLFILTCLLNMGWILAWHHRLIGLSVAVMLLLLGALIRIHRILPGAEEGQSRYSALLIRTPFRIYLGWISVATIANITALLVHLNWSGFGLPPQFWFVLMVAVAAALSLVMLFREGDFPFTAVVFWAFVGILAKRLKSTAPGTELLYLAPLAGMVLLAGGTAIRLLKRHRADLRT